MRHDKAENLLRLALRLQASRAGLSLGEIMEDFAVSRRTAERMRDAVERLFPQLEVVDAGERTKRWRLPRGSLDGLGALAAGELAPLATAQELMRREGLADEADRLDSLADKIRAALPPAALRRLEPDLEALSRARGIAMRPGPQPRVDPAVLEAVQEAILACRTLRFDYRARETGRTSRPLVCPYGILYGHRHYLVAFSMNPEVRDYRLYSLADIGRAEVTESSFERREFSLAEYAARSFGVYQEDPVDVVWKFSPAAAVDARHFLFHPTQEMEEQPDGALLVRFRAGGLREMCWHLFTWGGAVEVLEPEALRKMYAEMLAEVKRKVEYSKPYEEREKLSNDHFQ